MRFRFLSSSPRAPLPSAIVDRFLPISATGRGLRTIAWIVAVGLGLPGLYGCGDDGSTAPFAVSGWAPFGTSLDNSVVDVVDLGGELVVAGSFRLAGGISSSGISVLEEESWSTLRTPVPVDFTTATIHHGQIVAGAEGVAAGFLLAWNGQHWEPFQGGTDGPVHFVKSLGDHLLVYGDFDIVGGDTSAPDIALWDGTSWNRLSRSGINGLVHDAAYFQDDLYLAGTFSRAGLLQVPGIVRWNVDGFHSVDEDLDYGRVFALELYDGELLLGGEFSVDGLPTTLAGWDGKEWHSLLTGLEGHSVTSLARLDGEVIASGYQPGSPGRRPLFLRVNEEGLSPFASPTVGLGTERLVTSGGHLYATGGFEFPPSPESYGLIRWDGSEWSPVKGAPVARVEGLVADSRLIVVTDPTRVDVRDTRGVAMWDGDSWQPMGEGLTGRVEDLRVFAGDLYALGAFTHSGSRVVESFARWDGDTWRQLGAGFGNSALSTRDLWVDEEGTYAANSDGLWRLNGDSWELLDPDPECTALTRFQGQVIVGRNSPYDEVGGVGYLDDGEMKPFAGGLTIHCRSFCVYEDALYAVGWQVDDAPLIAVSDGKEWRGLASEWNGTAREIREVRGELVVLGDFYRDESEHFVMGRIVGGTIEPHSEEDFRGLVRSIVDWHGRDLVCGSLVLPGRATAVPLAIR